jgi:MGT family glycosyltransferase
MTKFTQRNFLFAIWEGGGNVMPALTAARKMVERGHRVRVIGEACNRRESEASGAAFTTWMRAPSRPSRDRESDIPQDWMAKDPTEGLTRWIDGIWAGRALDYARDVIDELKREPADLVVTSEMLFGVPAGCEAVGQPYVNLTANPSLFPMKGVPPMGPGLTPPRNAEERVLHDEMTQACIALLDHGLPALNRARLALGLKALAHLVDQTERAEALLLGTARAFDFAPQAMPAKTHYVGPLLDQPTWADALDPALTEKKDLPIVAVGFSTTFQGHIGILQRVVDAIGSLPVRGIVTLGDTILPDEVKAPANVRLLHSAPHDALMRVASIVVTHGGHGTVSRALMAQKPMLVIPHGRDQNDNAARVTWRGAGLMLMPDAQTDAIREALNRLLTEQSFAADAQKLGGAIAAEAAQSPLVSLLESYAMPAKTLCPA